jgi:hypothetical protein
LPPVSCPAPSWPIATVITRVVYQWLFTRLNRSRLSDHGDSGDPARSRRLALCGHPPFSIPRSKALTRRIPRDTLSELSFRPQGGICFPNHGDHDLDSSCDHPPRPSQGLKDLHAASQPTIVERRRPRLRVFAFRSRRSRCDHAMPAIGRFAASPLPSTRILKGLHGSSPAMIVWHRHSCLRALPSGIGQLLALFDKASPKSKQAQMRHPPPAPGF